MRALAILTYSDPGAHHVEAMSADLELDQSYYLEALPQSWFGLAVVAGGHQSDGSRHPNCCAFRERILEIFGPAQNGSSLSHGVSAPRT